MVFLRSLVVSLVVSAWLFAQPNDSGGALLAEQAAFDVEFYDLTLSVDPGAKSLRGALEVQVKVTAPLAWLVLDLDEALTATGAFEGASSRPLERRGGRLWIDLGTPRAVGDTVTITVRYEGSPRVAPNPPWDGGFTWSKTKSGEPWIATSCQMQGADLWWPCKDHPSDEPAGMALHITVPKPLVVASNGKLEKVEEKGKFRTYHWRVSTPINNYVVALNIAPYRIIKESFKSVTGETVPLMFFALPENERKARALIPEIKDHLRFFEELFGPYPFRGDKYGVAETPHLGMEHQTIIAYGYGYKKNEFGYDWLHHHELSHEWWGNLVTASDWSDFWIHEGIGTYTQCLYVEKLLGTESYLKAMKKRRRFLANRRPVAPKAPKTSREMYSTGGAFDNDIYDKGAWILHSLRGVIGKEALLQALRRLAYATPDLEAIKDGGQCHFATTDDFIRLVEEASQQKLAWFFDVYLRQPKLPRLIEEREGKELRLRWEVPEDLPFPMPIDVKVGKERRRVAFQGNDAKVALPSPNTPVEIDPEGWVLRVLGRPR